MDSSIFSFDISEDMCSKMGFVPGTAELAPSVVQGRQAFLPAFAFAVPDWIGRMQTDYPGVDILHNGTASDPYPIALENLYSLLSTDPTAMYNTLNNSNGNLGRINFEPDNITFFLVASYFSESAFGSIMQNSLSYYIIFLTI